MPARFSASFFVKWLCIATAVVIAIQLAMGRKPWDAIASFGNPESPKQFAIVYEWWAWASNAALLLILAFTAKWWLLPAQTLCAWLPPISSSRWFWPLVACAMLLTAVFGWQRIHYSLWDDEDSSLRRVIHGHYSQDKDGSLIFKPRNWTEALWNYRKPTNHHLQTILSKFSLHTWQAIARPKGLQFSEAAVRFPVYLAAILSVGALALLIRRLGFPCAAVVAAFLLALHPWHMRYATELRGYTFTMLFGPLMLYCLLEAIETGRWRWWIAFAASEFALLYAYPGCLYMLVAANACGLAALWFRLNTAGERKIFLPRLPVASLLAGMVWLQLMLPCLPQLASYLRTERALGILDTRWHYNLLAHFASGIPWNNSDNAAAGYPELLWMLQSQPWLKTTLLFLPFLFLLLGIIRLLVSRPAGWIFLVTMLLPALGVYFQARTGGQYLYEWYLIFALPGLAACVATGMDGIVQPLRRARWGRLASPALLALWILVFALSTQPARHWLLTHPLQPMKDSVLAVRPSLDPNDPRQAGILTVAVNIHVDSYDAHVLEAENPDQLAAIACRADTEQKPLYVISGNDLSFAALNPGLRGLVRDPNCFEPIITLPGLDPTLTHSIWRYKPGSLK